MSELTEKEINQLKESIEKAISDGLMQPEDASQLRRMIAYYAEKIERNEKSC